MSITITITRFPWLCLAIAATGCAHEARFPLAVPMTRDGDLDSVNARCREESASGDPHHLVCAPERYRSSTYWDGGDNLFWRPLVETLGVVVGAESVNVNALDDVPDSAWFTNRAALDLQGACSDAQRLDPEHAAEGAWTIDKGKEGGSTHGFRVVVPGKGKFLFKADSLDDQPERSTAASVIGAAVLHALGYYTSCEQVIWVRPSVFRLTPGLVSRGTFTSAEPFDRTALDALFAQSPKRGDRVRFNASAWIPGYVIGPFRWEGTRDDDPNDVVAHEDRRELRAMRLVSAWLARYDAREGNTLDAWVADDRKRSDSSPGHVIHYQLDLSESLGGGYPWSTTVSRRLNHTYVVDWADSAADLVLLGIPSRPWDRSAVVPGREIFGFYDVKTFEPAAWKPQYPNPAFERMTERDAAWIARLLARITPDRIRALAAMGDFTDPSNATYLAGVMQARLDKILERWLTRLSPVGDVRIAGDRLCGTDLAEARGLRPSPAFHFRARQDEKEMSIDREANGRFCVLLEHAAGARERTVIVEDGVARGPLVAHVWDLGAGRGFQLIGIERRP